MFSLDESEKVKAPSRVNKVTDEDDIFSYWANRDSSNVSLHPNGKFCHLI